MSAHPTPPSPQPSFKRTCPCTILPPPFLIFQIPPSGGGKRNFRLQHMRCVITCACLCTCLKHWRRTKKSMPCLIKKASRCAADHTPKTAKFFIFSFLSNTKILGENHVYLFVILLVQLWKWYYQKQSPKAFYRRCS